MRKHNCDVFVLGTTTEVSGCGTNGTKKCTIRVQEVDASLANR